MMKLFAFKDQVTNENKDYGRHHALDLYTIMATTTENEWEKNLNFREEFRDEEKVIEARSYVSKYFSDVDKMGIIRIKESPYFRDALQIDKFISAMKEIFPADQNG